MVVAVGYNNPINAYIPGIQTMKTGVWTGSQVAQYSALVSGANYTIGGAAPGTAGLAFLSNGASSNPSFQSIAAAGAITSITGNSGGAQVPSSGNFNILGTGSITTVGTANTETIQLTGLTNHNLLIGAGTATITKLPPTSNSGIPLISQGISSDPGYGTASVGGGGTGSTSFNAYGPIYGGTSSTSALSSATPSSTSGIPFISQGVASAPIYGTAVVAGGGTGLTSATAYAPICGGTSSTGNLQSATTGLSTSGFVLQTNGASALPSFVTPSGLSLSRFSSTRIQLFTGSGTYTPTSGMSYCIIETVGAGGGGGGASTTTAGINTGGGGGSGGYARAVFTAATIGASQTITIGAGGTAGDTSGSNGATGGTTTVGSLVSCSGGAGGFGLSFSGVKAVSQAGGAGGGTVTVTGQVGSADTSFGAGGAPGMGTYLTSGPQFGGIGGAGGNSRLGQGAASPNLLGGFSSTATGGAGQLGGGGAGGGSADGGTGAAGGAGGAGYVIVTEFIAS